MRNISRRIDAVEKKMNIGNQSALVRVMIIRRKNSKTVLPENIEDWPVYKSWRTRNPNSKFMLFLA